MNEWNYKLQKTVHIITAILMIIYPCLVGIITIYTIKSNYYSLFWEPGEVVTASADATYSSFTSAIIFVVSLLWLSMSIVSIICNFFKKTELTIYTLVVYVVQCVLDIYVLAGMEFGTFKAKIPVFGVGWMYFNSEVGGLALLFFFLSAAMAVVSLINMRIKNVLETR